MAKEKVKNPNNPSGLKEAWRRFLVSLKRKPQMIAMVVLVIAFVVYSFRLSNISDTTARIQGTGMGLAGFATMLFSMLSFVCMINAFPHRKKVNIPMLIILFAMFGIILFCDTLYLRGIAAAIVRTEAEGTTLINENTAYIPKARTTVTIHRVIIIIDVLLVVLLPVYSRFIKRINTSIDVAGNEDMAAIDISGEE